jgi:ADP-heptose:LPS heptosyltransferase
MTSAPDANEKALIADVRAARDRGAAAAFDFAGQLSLKELAALTARARLFVGVDSAPMHMAAAMGTPVVAIFGPSGDREWGALGRWPPRRRLEHPSLPPLRNGRLQRQQGQRLPHHFAGGAGAGGV